MATQRGWVVPVLVVGVFLVLSVAMTWPLGTDPSGRALDLGGDTRLFLWTVGWDLHALATPGQPLFDANIFFPSRHTLAYSENLVGFSLLAAPVRALGGGLVTSLNTASLLSLALCGLGAFVLARQLGLGVPASLLAGVVFAFAPPRLMRLGQPHQLAVQWIPFCLAFVHRYLASGTRRSLALAAVFFFLQALTSGHGALFLSAALGLLVVYRWLTGAGPGAARPADLSVAIVITTLAVAALLAPYAEVRSGQGLRRGLEEAELWSPNAESFLASPTHVHRALLSFVDTHDARTYLFPGLLPLLLALGAFAWRRPEQSREEKPAPTSPARWRGTFAGALDVGILVVGLAAFLALATGGFRFRLGGLDVSARDPGRVVVVLAVLVAARLILARRVSSFVTRGLARRGRALRGLVTGASGPDAGFYALLGLVSLWAVLGPRFGLYAVLYRVVPGFDLVRVPSRFATLTVLALAVLAAFGLERLSRRWPTLAPVALLLVLGEFWLAPLDAGPYRVEIPAIDRWLATQPAEPVVELPVADPRDDRRAASLNSTYMLHSTVHWHPLVNGYSGFTPASHDLLFRQLVNFPDERSLDALEEIGVRHVLVHSDLYPPDEWPAVEERLRNLPSRLRLVHREGNGFAFELRESARDGESGASGGTPRTGARLPHDAGRVRSSTASRRKGPPPTRRNVVSRCPLGTTSSVASPPASGRSGGPARGRCAGESWTVKAGTRSPRISPRSRSV
jgi:hypothetical protein